MLYLMYPPRTRALLSVRKTHNGKRSRIHDGELARGQPGRQLAGSLSPSDGHGGSDPAYDSFRVEPPFFGAAPHGETS